MESKHWVAFACVGIAAGSTFMWTKLALQELQPVQLLALRFALATVLLAVMAMAQRPAWPVQGRAWISPLVMGLFNIGTPHLLIAWAQQRVDSTVTGILNASTPLFTMFVAHLMLRDDRLSRGRLIGAGTSFAGVMLVMSRNMKRGMSGTLVGQVAILASSLSFGLSSVVARRFHTNLSSLMLALISNAVACLAVAAIGLAIGVQPFVVPQRFATMLAVGFQGLIQSSLMYVLFFFLLNTVGPSRTQMVGYVLPVIAVFLGVAILGEPLYWTALGGGLMIIGGIAVANTARSPARPERP